MGAYQSGIVSMHTNRNNEPKMQNTIREPCSASQSLTKYVSPNVNLSRESATETSKDATDAENAHKFLALIATNASSFKER